MLPLFTMLALLTVEAPPPPQSADVSPPRKGTLCVLPAEACVETTGMTAPVSAHDAERLFVWTSDDGKRVVAGVIAPKAEEVSLAGEREIAVSLRGDATRDWPTDVEIQFGSGRRMWKWTVPARAARRLAAIGAPAGQYRMLVKAHRHKTLRREAVDVRRENAKLGEIVLEPLPAISVRVVDGHEKALAGAQLFLGNMKLCANANEQGVVRCELTEPLARDVIVTSPGYAFRRLALRDLQTENDLGTIRLTEGAMLTVTVERPELEDRKLTATLSHDDPNEYDHSPIHSRELKERERVLEFPDLAAGTYQLLLAGEGPLERLSTEIEVRQGGTTERTIRIEPYALEGTVTFGAAKVMKGEIEVGGRENAWRGKVPITEGRFGGTAWQHGFLSGFVRAPELGNSEHVTSPKLGTNPSTWNIALSNRVITGAVRDAETNALVPRPSLELRVEYANGGGRLMGSAPLQPDGTYRIFAGRLGTYELIAKVEGYAVGRWRMEVKADDPSIQRDLLLDRGIAQTLQLVWAAGGPVANATIIEGIRNDRINPELMISVDGAGQVIIQGRPNESRLVYVIPREGSFAIVRLQMPAKAEDSKPLRVTVQMPVGTIRARMADRDGKPVARATIMARYDGEWLPFAILRFVSPDGLSAGGPVRVLSRLPAGVYELWGFRDRMDELPTMQGNETRPPVRVGLSTGEQIVEVPVP